MTLTEAIDSLKTEFAGRILNAAEFRDEQTLTVAKVDCKALLRHCRDQLAFDYLVDVGSIDNMGEEPRFEIVYQIYSYEHGIHLRVKTAVSEDDLTADTVTDLWPTANWHEREVYDMMGIDFIGHPDMRRILMWEGYPFYPLRKDFPLAGKPSNVPEIAFTKAAPQAGGPFVTTGGATDPATREPRSRE